MPALASPQVVHDSVTLERLFNNCFLDGERTRLVGGASEPIYLPADPDHAENRLYYREDYFASALHEISHWCIAGRLRRTQKDFGYWYEPEGRSGEQQEAFLAAEARPQALEWYFSVACDYPFQLSLDSFEPDGYEAMRSAFAIRVCEQAEHLRRHGLPPRAGQFFRALSEQYGTALSPASLPPLQPEQLL
jgi:elongation factor P hydroxylase